MDRLSEKMIIKAEAEKLGFCFSGFTVPGTLDHFSRYVDWVNSGFYAGMNYLARADHIEKRKNPLFIYPECRTILVLGIPIRYDFPQSEFSAAAFAQYWDYHEQIRELCEKLFSAVSDSIQKPVNRKICVDSSPVLERSLAVQAGLGWIGKNSMLIHPTFGSTTLLAECFIDLELEPDKPYSADHCGKCFKCSSACPTQCIDPEKRTIDSNRCISYQTLENRGNIDLDVAAMCGNKIFGCDICVQVCPWNRKNLSNRTPLQTHGILIGDASDLNLSDFEFNEKYRGTPIVRQKNSGWKRNLNNAINNLG